MYVGLHRGKDFEAKGRKIFSPGWAYILLLLTNTYHHIQDKNTKMTPAQAHEAAWTNETKVKSNTWVYKIKLNLN